MDGSERKPAYLVHCFIHPFQSLYHLCNIYSGLFTLASQGLVRVDFESPGPDSPHALDPVTLWMEVFETETGKQRRIALDTYDRSDVFARDSLKLSDVYFKRSYYAPDVDVLESDLKRKVVPFGLNYACRTSHSTLRLLLSFLPMWARSMLSSPKAAQWRLYQLSQFLASPAVSLFEQAPEHPVERSVLFQSRIWVKSELVADSEDEINRHRVDLTRSLRKEFGASFHGGIVPSRLSRRYCPEELADKPTRPSLYAARSKQAMIGIYTRGLFQSTGFKLGEYLASSKCIVAESIRNALPEPLQPGRNYLEFTTADECVERCRELLGNNELASQMRKNNWDYYQRQVRPDRHISNCLDRAFGRASIASDQLSRSSA